MLRDAILGAGPVALETPSIDEDTELTAILLARELGWADQVD
jgi:hypothetical protein